MKMLETLTAPSGAARDGWLERLRRARALVGEAHFLQAPAIVGDERCFPDRFTADAHGATRVLRRMLLHAARTIDIPGAVAWFDDVHSIVEDGERTVFVGPSTRLNCSGSGDDIELVIDSTLVELPDALLEAVAFTVARVELFKHGHDAGATEDVVAMAVALGFGWLLLQGSWVVEQGGDVVGRSAISWQHRSAALRASPGELAFLLATWAQARGVTTSKGLGDGLRANQRAALDAALKLEPPAFFGAAQAPPTWALFAATVDTSDVDAGDDNEPDHALSDTSTPVFRVLDRRAAGPVLLTTAAALVWGVVCVAIGDAVPSGAAVVGVVVMLVAGFTAAWRNTFDICSEPDCKAELPAFAATCPGCGRPLGGRIASADDRLAAEEDWRRDRVAPPAATSAAPLRVARDDQ
jgi:hypothetical protein